MARLLRDPRELRMLLNWRNLPDKPAEADRKDEVKAGELEKTKDFPARKAAPSAKGSKQKS